MSFESNLSDWEKTESRKQRVLKLHLKKKIPKFANYETSMFKTKLISFAIKGYQWLQEIPQIFFWKEKHSRGFALCTENKAEVLSQ